MGQPLTCSLHAHQYVHIICPNAGDLSLVHLGFPGLAIKSHWLLKLRTCPMHAHQDVHTRHILHGLREAAIEVQCLHRSPLAVVPGQSRQHLGLVDHRSGVVFGAWAGHPADDRPALLYVGLQAGSELEVELQVPCLDEVKCPSD